MRGGECAFVWLDNGEGMMALRSAEGALTKEKVLTWSESCRNVDELEEDEEDICMS